MTQESIHIKNKKAHFNYEITDLYVAGIQLTGTEIKSVRDSKVSINEAYCVIIKGEIFVKNMSIAIYEQASYNNHDPLRLRKLLLNKTEIAKIERGVKEKKLTIIPTRLFINDKGKAKLEIGMARGKKMYDKREDIKKKDLKRDADHVEKIRV